MKYSASLLMASLLALSPVSDIQAKKDPCRNIHETKDPFTNEIQKWARLGIYSNAGGYWEFCPEKKGENYFLTVNISVSSLIDKPIPAGETLYIKLQNEKIIELSLDADCKPTFQASGAVVSTWTIRKQVDLKTIKRLSHSIIVAGRVKIDSQELNLVTNPDKPRSMEAIMDAAGCIVGEPEENAGGK